ncbi:unnamed protein product [Peniophora sp. CBMAI 1063]|nr:unnamed protein product [Peniophora sp. CBMAI 1063]
MSAGTAAASPSPSPPPNDSLFGDLNLDAMLDEPDSDLDDDTPASALGKRPRSDDDDDNDDPRNDEDGSLSSAPVATDGNIAVYARRQAKARRLNTERSKAVMRFVMEPNACKLVDLYVQGQEALQAIAAFKAIQPPWEVSPDLELNLKRFTHAVAFSSKLSSYRDDTALNIVLKIVKGMNLSGLYTGIWLVPADLDKVKAVILDALTQFRSMIKKALRASMSAKDSIDHVDAFKLTIHIADKADVKATVPLTCRVALMRYVYRHRSASDFWLAVDKQISELLAKSNGDPARIAKLYRKILTKDLKEHGQNAAGEHSLPEDDVACERQQLVADAMDGEDEE